MEKTWFECLKEFEGMRLKEVKDHENSFSFVFDSGEKYYPSIVLPKSTPPLIVK